MVPSKDNRTKRHLFGQMIMTPGCPSPLFDFASQAIGPVAVVAVGLWIAWATLLFELSTQSTASLCRPIFLTNGCAIEGQVKQFILSFLVILG